MLTIHVTWISLIIVIIYIIYYYDEIDEHFEESIKSRLLDKDGFFVLHNDKYLINTVDKPCDELQKDILNKLPDGYTFIDYYYIVNNAAISTFHRDVTSSQNIYKTQYPTYTVALYNSQGPLLSVCPGSHKTYPFVTSQIVNITGKPSTAIIFDCDILHAGCLNQCKKRTLYQYKVCHKDDLNKLSHLNGIKINKTGVCSITNFNIGIRKLAYYCEFPINYILYPLMIKREKSDNIIGIIQSYIPLTYYNNY